MATDVGAGDFLKRVKLPFREKGRRIDYWKDGAGDQVPILIEVDWIDRLNVEDVLRVVSVANVSEAAHKAKDAQVGDDQDFDRLVELGSLVECLGGMCALHLMLLHEIAHALDEVHEAEVEQEKRHRRHH